LLPLKIVFYTCLALLIYVYAGYPLLVWLLSRLRDRRVQPMPDAAAAEPSVTVLIAAYNEADCIEQTVRNKLELNYPADKLEIIVVSDESDDGTDDIVAGVADERVTLIRQQPRAGKTAGLNLGLPRARGEIVVFSDANSLYHPDALRHLIAPLADPAVGYVTGRMVYKAPDGSATGEGCSAYMRYENALRRWETGNGSIVGVDGGIDAVRRELYQPMRADQLPDFVLPLAVRRQGYRVVFAERALLYEEALAAADDEFRMRVRVGLRAWHALKDMAALFDPLRYGLFAWQLFSHKVLRYLGPLFQIGLLASNLILAPFAGSWGAWLALQFLFYLAAAAGHFLPGRSLPRLITLCYYLCLINAASAIAFVQFLQGRKQVVWNPRT